MTMTAKQLIEQARIRHVAFLKLQLPDGALVLALNELQRSALLTFSDAIEPLLSQARQVAAVVTGALVGVDDGGVPYYLTGSGDGYPVQSDGGVPYIDFTGVPIALDPFGVSGSTPGFPLPDEFIKMINVTAATLFNAALQVDVVSESRRAATPLRTLAVFISGNRLVPIREGVSPYSDSWSSVTSVALSYIAMQTITALTDVVTLPAQINAALVAALAERFAFGVEGMSTADRRYFTEEKLRAETQMLEAADMILGEVTSGHVQFNG